MMDWVEFSAKTVDEALTKALIKLETNSENIEYEVIEKETNGILGLFSKPAKIRVKLKNSVDHIAENFLTKIIKAMNIEAVIDVDYAQSENILDIDIKGEDMGVLIGKRGQTLDSLQYLTSLVVNKEANSYIKVKLDTENYRARRKETLENLARNISYKVKRTRKPVSLEPMNPYERRVIHSVLQNDKFVETHSEGEDPFRKVVITLKKSAKDYSKNTNRTYNKNYNRENSYNKEKTYNKENNKTYGEKHIGENIIE